MYLSDGVWKLQFIVLEGILLYIRKLPDDKILDYKAKAIENKRRLGIKIYRF